MKKVIYILIIIILLAFIILPRQNPQAVNLHNTFANPSSEHYLGTDNLGRDIYSLIASGFLRTLTVISIASLISLTVGVTLGMIGGYFGKNLEIVIQFLTDMLLITPTFIVALLVTVVFGFNPIAIGLAIGISDIGSYSNQALILTKDFKQREFIQVEKVLGISNIQIIFRHIFPNIVSPILTTFSSKASSITLQFASLAFIGLGADVTSPDWGTMLYSYRIYITDKPLLVLWPTLAIFLLSISFHLLFDNREIIGKKRGGIYE